MFTLLFKFSIYLQRQDVMRNYHGPLFHRWLPDGLNDAIILDTTTPNTELKVWFERRGFVNHGMIEFDISRREIDPTIIPTQAALEAGPLYGSLEIQELIEEEVAALLNNSIGAQSYIEFGDKIVNKLIHPPVSRFINTLRTKYGQYWIRELEKWDSRDGSLGAYCNFLSLQWSLDNGVTWSDFMPDEPIRIMPARRGSSKSFRNYLTMQDWEELAQLSKEKYELPLASFFLSRAQQLLDEENYRYALIEGITALELAISETIKSRLQTDEVLLKEIQRFWTMPIKTQVIITATLTGTISPENLSHSLEAIDISNNTRNKALHEGAVPGEVMRSHIMGLLNTIAGLLFSSNFKLPSARLGNRRMSIENWEKELEKHE